jgi:hypothetical protein
VRAVTASVVGRAGDEQLAYLAVHNHSGTDTVGLSRTDLASHERGYPSPRQITRQVVGAVVLTEQAAAGDLWLPTAVAKSIAEVVVAGNNLIRLQPRPAPTANPE